MDQAEKQVFQEAAILRLVVLHGAPIALIASALGASRQAIYRSMDRARYNLKRQERQKLRAAIKAAQALRAAQGLPPLETSRLTPRKRPSKAASTPGKAAKPARRPVSRLRAAAAPARTSAKAPDSGQSVNNKEEQR